MSDGRVDIAAVRAKLAGLTGKQYWQGIEQLAETDEFMEYLHREFPRQASVWDEGAAKGGDAGMSRRGFLKLLGASLALAGLAGCTNVPARKIVPYVKAPDINQVPGKSLFYTTAMTHSGYAMGLLVETNEGRPTKVEGNPDHPASLGSTDTFAQASILGLYDPARSTLVLKDSQRSTYADFTAAFAAALGGASGNGGAGIRILTEPTSSPTLIAQMESILSALPNARWIQWEPAGNEQAEVGARLAFGRDVNTVYRFDRADAVLSLDSDFLQSHADTLRYARDFIDRRRIKSAAGDTSMNRLYAVEGTPTLTGAKADHRLRVQSRDVLNVALVIAGALGVQGLPTVEGLPQGIERGTLEAIARDLRGRAGASIVIAGAHQSPAVHALTHAMNAALNNVGKTVLYTDPVVARPGDRTADLRTLVADMNAGTVQLLLVLGANPVYTAPADLGFADAMKKVGTRIHLGLYADATAAASNWHVPAAHFMEAWSDARAFDGTVSIVQPLIEPLYADVRSPHEILTLFGGQESKSYDQVRGYWQKTAAAGGDFETWWRDTLNRGTVANSALPAVTPALTGDLLTAVRTTGAGAGQGFEVNFRPDAAIWDGRFINNAWLQELPKPLNLLTWDNAVMMSPATAQQLGVSSEDLVEVRYGGRSVRGAVWIWPGHVDNSVTLHLGYGQSDNAVGSVASSSAGSVQEDILRDPRPMGSGSPLGAGTGFNAYALRTSTAPWFDGGAEVVKVGGTYRLATTQFHWQMEGRDLVKTGTLAQYQQDPHFVGEQHEEISLYPKWEYPNYKWGMAIDLNACVGCNACVLACQAENNVPTVGKQGVLRQREMHWLRVDRYYEGSSLDDPQTVFQPVPCQQCEDAPCEVVCPVMATAHSEDGLNDMTYNRCVGTRYCSNNCPYKVRRFNFYSYTEQVRAEPTLKMLQNPDVTVRNRGVMEKCTYCVQRIREAQGTAETEGRAINTGEVITACAAACPTHAISFGNLNNQAEEVNSWKALPLNYALLNELNTRPRTTYLAALRNPNPEIQA